MTTDAARQWKALVEAENSQTERLRDRPAEAGDHWQGMTVSFRADPHRAGDPMLERLAKDLRPGHSLLDVGAGAGRLSLPLALRIREVVAVEPSPAMAQAFREEAAAHGIANVRLVESRWEDAVASPADFVLCCHVLYTARDIDAFVAKLTSHARERVMVVLFQDPPQHRVYPMWPEIHGEARIRLPSAPDLLTVLEEMEIDATVEELPSAGLAGFDTTRQAWDSVRGMLFLTEGSEKDRALGQAIPRYLRRRDGQYYIKDAEPMRPMLISWPARASP